jgi:hypothetical protein
LPCPKVKVNETVSLGNLSSLLGPVGAEETSFRNGRFGPEAPDKRIDESWCAIGRRGGKSRAMATMAAYYSGLCDYSDKLARGEKGVVLIIAQDKRAAKVSLD